MRLRFLARKAMCSSRERRFWLVLILVFCFHHVFKFCCCCGFGQKDGLFEPRHARCRVANEKNKNGERALLLSRFLFCFSFVARMAVIRFSYECRALLIISLGREEGGGEKEGGAQGG